MKFLKEYITLFLIILFVISIDFMTSNITKNSLEEINKKIAEVEENLNTDYQVEKIRELSELWKNKESKLAYYMEHNELEEISSKVTDAKSNIENNRVEEAIEQIDEIKFRVEHIKNKQKFELKNIF